MNDYYQILGIQRNASYDEVRKAFRQLAKKMHPDVNPGKAAHDHFQKINEAYQVLKDEVKRKDYDARLRTGNFTTKVYYRPAQYPSSPSPKQKTTKKYRTRKYKKKYKREKPAKWEKVSDFLLFLTLALAGIFAIVNGFYRLAINPLPNHDPWPGFIGGIFFSSILIYFWIMKNKAYKE
ncbi:MAG: J domain-containing protein [Bacteroidota bacterium]